MIDIVPLIAAALEVPDPTRSEEEADRFHHRDLDDCSEGDLRRELSFIRTMTFLVDSPWLAERELRIGEQLRLRHERRGRRA